MRKMSAILALFISGLGLAGVASGQIGGGGGFGGGGNRNDPLTLLNNPSVKKELDITDEQGKAIPDAVMKALSGVLNEKQYARFKQIELQQRGTAAFSDEKVQSALKMTSAQKDNIKTILEDSRKEMREAFQGGGKGSFEKLDNLRKETTEKVQGVLTSDQKKAWRDMTGETFKIERQGFGGGGFGRKGGDNTKKKEKVD